MSKTSKIRRYRRFRLAGWPAVSAYCLAYNVQLEIPIVGVGDTRWEVCQG